MYEITQQADRVVYQHSVSFYQNEIFGLFLGPKDNTKSNIIDQSLPLFHNIPLNPSIDAALHLATLYAKSQNRLILGLYYAPKDSNSDYNHLSPLLASIIKTLKSNQENQKISLFVYIPESSLEKSDSKRYIIYNLPDNIKSNSICTFDQWTKVDNSTLIQPVFKKYNDDFIKNPIVDYDIYVDSLFSANWLSQS